MHIKMRLFLSLLAFFQGSVIHARESNLQNDDVNKNIGHFFGEASFVYFNAKLDNLEFVALSNTLTDESISPKTIDSHLKQVTLDPSWDKGVRANIGYTTNDSNWTFMLSGIYLPNKSSKSVSTTPTLSGMKLEYYIPLLNQSLVGSGVEEASAKWILDFGAIDLIAARSIYSSYCFIFAPYIGIRAVNINQKFNVDFENVHYFTEQGLFELPKASTKFHHIYHAIGLKPGISFESYSFYNFSIFGDIFASLVYGPSKVNQHIKGYNVETNSEGMPAFSPITINDKKNSYQLSANFESEIGLKYTNYLLSNNFSVSFSYFFSIWFDQNLVDNHYFTGGPIAETLLFTNYISLQKRVGNLQLHGFQIKGEIVF